MKHPPSRDPMTRVLARFRDPERTTFADAWVGLEPTFQTAKSVRKWRTMSAESGGEDAYFKTPTCSRRRRRSPGRSASATRHSSGKGRSHCMFARVELDEDLDPWKVRRQNLSFHWADDDLEPLQVRFGLDPETFEYSIKPVPLAWFYDERFVAFPRGVLLEGAAESRAVLRIAHGGGAVLALGQDLPDGSLLADDIAYKLSHPELATWIMDWPNPDDRAFRATRPRLAAFRAGLEALLGRRFPSASHRRPDGRERLPRPRLRSRPPARARVDGSRAGGQPAARATCFRPTSPSAGPSGCKPRTSHPGYWQSAHPDEDGYRPDQIMRYSEGNLNRLQIAGELHVKSGKVLEAEQVPALDAPLRAGAC